MTEGEKSKFDPSLTRAKTPCDVNGVRVFKAYLSTPAQQELVQTVREICRLAPLYVPVTPRGQKMSVRMSAAGSYGWVTDHGGYRYEPHHPQGTAWPPIPSAVLAIWRELAVTDRAPECCLVNFYAQGARMGLHQDRDEADLTQPVLSISLGDEGLFRVGGTKRGGSTQSIWLQSGDVAVLDGAARRAYHGVDRIRFRSSTLLREGGRLNLTLRVVT